VRRPGPPDLDRLPVVVDDEGREHDLRLRLPYSPEKAAHVCLVVVGELA